MGKNIEKWYQNWSWLGYLNFFILQWFFIRLAKYKEILDYQLEEVSICKHGLEIGGKCKEFKWKYRILKWVLPLTGWWNNYKYLGNRQNKKLKTNRK